MEKRIAIFKQSTQPLLEEFTKTTEVINIDASRSIEDVNTEVHNKLGL